MAPMDIFKRATAAMNSGDFTASLQDFMWLHEHSLEVDSAFVGVRNTYVLAIWAELGRLHPAAQLALEERAKTRTAQFLVGRPNGLLFTDLFALNEYAGTPGLAAAAFEELRKNNPEIADFYFNEMPALLQKRGIVR